MIDMTTEESKPIKGKKGRDEDVSDVVEKLLKKKDEVPVGNLLSLVKDSGLIEGFEEKIKRKYKVK